MRTIVLGAVASLLAASTACADDLVRVHRLPNGAKGPSVAVRGEAVHLAWGQQGSIFHAESKDGGRTFGEPTRVSSEGEEAFSAMERGPRVAVGGDGTVHVVWSPPRLRGARYSSRAPGAASFTASRDLLGAGGKEAEGLTVAASGDVVLAVWLDNRGPAPANSPIGLPLWGSRSTDGGRTFSAPAALAHDYDGGACACCHLDAGVDGGGRIVVAFRGARDDVRDVFVLRGDAEARRFRSAPVTRENWTFRGCPMDGPRVASGEPLVVACTVDGRVGLAAAGRQGFGPQARPAEGGDRGRFPLALRGTNGRLFFAWVAGDNHVHWQVHGDKGAVVAAGDAGAVAGESRPTGFLDGAGVFVIVQ